jgi:hypothetical protein
VTREDDAKLIDLSMGNFLSIMVVRFQMDLRYLGLSLLLLPDSCRANHDLSYSSHDRTQGMDTFPGGVVAIFATHSTMLVSIPPNTRGGVPTPEDVGLWQKMQPGQPSGAAE